MKTRIIFILTSLFSPILMMSAFAQGSPPATPIDGGLSLLLAAGGVYGLKKLADKRKK